MFQFDVNSSLLKMKWGKNVFLSLQDSETIYFFVFWLKNFYLIALHLEIYYHSVNSLVSLHCIRLQLIQVSTLNSKIYKASQVRWKFNFVPGVIKQFFFKENAFWTFPPYVDMFHAARIVSHAWVEQTSLTELRQYILLKGNNLLLCHRSFTAYYIQCFQFIDKTAEESQFHDISSNKLDTISVFYRKDPKIPPSAYTLFHVCPTGNL